MSEETKHDDLPPLVQIGRYLRDVRQAKGLTLEDVCLKTRISKRYLDAIENGRFNEMPGRTYVLGFTKTLCKMLKVDVDLIIAGVKQEFYGEGRDQEDDRQASLFPRFL